MSRNREAPSDTVEVGSRIKVRFQQPAAWYWGTVTRAHDMGDQWKLRVAYDDGTIEDLFYSGDTDSVILERPLRVGDLILIEYDGEGEYLCKLVVRNKTWHVVSADGTFDEEVPFDPKEDTWQRFKFPFDEKKELVDRLSRVGTQTVKDVLAIIDKTSPHSERKAVDGYYEFPVHSLGDVTLWCLKQYMRHRQPAEVDSSSASKSEEVANLNEDEEVVAEAEEQKEALEVSRNRNQRKRKRVATSKAETSASTRTNKTDDSFYTVEYLCNKRKRNGITEYLVKWEGFESCYNTWEPESNLENVAFLLQEWEEKHSKDGKKLYVEDGLEDYPWKLGDSCQALVDGKWLEAKVVKVVEQGKPVVSIENMEGPQKEKKLRVPKTEYARRKHDKVQNMTAENKKKLVIKIWSSARVILSNLRRHNAAKPFLQPIEPEASFAAEYKKIIKEPMDLTTVSERLGRAGSGDPPKYTNPSELFHDLQLIWENAKKFNPREDFVYKQAEQIEEVAKRMWANSHIDERWGEVTDRPVTSPLVNPEESNRKRRRMNSGPELAKSEDQEMILGHFKGAWQCRPENFGRLIVKGNEGTYANGKGRLYDLKVLKTKAILAKWTRSDFAEHATGTLQLRISLNGMSWKGHWRASNGKPFGEWSGFRVESNDSTTIEVSEVKAGSRIKARSEAKGTSEIKAEPEMKALPKPKRNSTKWYILKVLNKKLHEGETKVSKNAVLIGISRTCKNEILIAKAIASLTKEDEYVIEHQRRKGSALELTENGKLCCKSCFG
eukprot:CAMPEP_0167748956 /NCGR_PEP_ID=MMETSP0110_2-20121227/5127_1 /TAXON_ID=629695 /ORGANISM="Gymnochlora sp., Strain CCMP2014" /LENGTH=777 /DNA_ID=CAMNT_0007634031 /DNA_START=8 /DNA_END=2341 /DNA_ORIENTATION=+